MIFFNFNVESMAITSVNSATISIFIVRARYIGNHPLTGLTIVQVSKLT